MQLHSSIDGFFIYLASAPHFIEPPQNIETVEGEFTTIACSADGKPKPRMAWSKDNTTLPDGLYLKTNSSDLQIRLVYMSEALEAFFFQIQKNNLKQSGILRTLGIFRASDMILMIGVLNFKESMNH